MLQVLGLGSTEEEAYLAVLARSGVAAGLPPATVTRLVRVGLLAPDPVRPGHYLVAELLPVLARALGVPPGRVVARPGGSQRSRPRGGQSAERTAGDSRRRPDSAGGRARTRAGRGWAEGEDRGHEDRGPEDKGREDKGDASPSGLAADDSELLELLASGLTDAAIGRRLGVSYRTVQRRVRTLMMRLEAATRFQAGSRAVHRGWL